MSSKLRFMLMQVRNDNDPMREQEVRCFARALQVNTEQIDVVDLINSHLGVTHLSPATISKVDAVLIGGSGDYSVATGGPWLPAALDVMAELAAKNKPTFASCWGFQAMAKALGGDVIHDPSNAELGTLPVTLTEQGKEDPVFGPLEDSSTAIGDVGGGDFRAIMGHEDHVMRLPPNAIPLARSERVANQAFCLRDKPVYATQFHPELDTNALIERLRAYPRYVEAFAGKPWDEFVADLRPTPRAALILRNFVDHVFN